MGYVRVMVRLSNAADMALVRRNLMRPEEIQLVLGDAVIVGQTILEKTDRYVDCHQKRLLPNPAHPDQPVLQVK